VNEALARSALLLPSELSWGDRIAVRLVLAQLRTWRTGHLVLALPDGRVLHFGDESAAGHVRVHVRRWRFFRRILTAGDIGNAESYMDGDWEASDLVELCRLYLLDQSMLDARSAWTVLARARHALIRWSQKNTRAGASRNIRQHYDLGNDFYRLFLDDSMSYSCAIFERPDATLEEAQRAKIERICRLLEPRPGHEVLEVGSGWGALAIHLAREHGCRVTSITLSEQQLELAHRRVAEAGVADRVEVRLSDYREVGGAYDRLVSVEMLEAVGYEYLGTFFETCARRLRPDGRMALQSIVFSDQGFDAYRRDFDFIRKHVFPGGLCPSLYEINRAVKERSDLRIVAADDIGPHYATTLRHWRQRFLARLEEVRALGFDESFCRMWEYYLACCEAAFSVRHVGNLQLGLVKAAPSR
jgi:cyclopropane-fatty-acyl-phospholipid synthase